MDTIQTLRQYYAEAADKPASFKAMEAHFRQYPPQSPLEQAYWAAYWALKAKYASFPWDKLGYLQKAKNIFAQAIQQAPDDIEIRFIRFSIELHLPAIVQDLALLQTDKTKILQHIETANLEHTLKQSIGFFLLNSGKCTIQEKELLQTKLTLK